MLRVVSRKESSWAAALYQCNRQPARALQGGCTPFKPAFTIQQALLVAHATLETVLAKDTCDYRKKRPFASDVDVMANTIRCKACKTRGRRGVVWRARQWQYLRAGGREAMDLQFQQFAFLCGGDGLLEHIQEATLDIAEQGGLPFRA
ncbi:hypothetical protein WJX74_010661 [Apatococcus lobatus]|uniref:Uncharacterized protein n=1 Tax=Apatococcus lobatus TaxID=904363 RepID=A0AAW1R139_9CHLO